MFTLFLPGIESASAEALPRMPALERLLVRGRASLLRGSPWAFLAELAGGDPVRWPVGPVSAMGELEAPPQACLRVEPLGADAGQQGTFRLPANSLDIAQGEADALAAAFRATLGTDGWRLEVAAAERWYLAWEPAHADAAVWRGCPHPAQSVGAGERPAPPEAPLRRLVSEVELLFHAHPVNTARRDRGAPIIAGLHPWGGGVVPANRVPAAFKPAASEEPYLAGLRRLGVVCGEAEERAVRGAVTNGGIAWPFPIETLSRQQVARIDQDWAAPLLGLLRRGRLDGVRIVTGRAVHETRRTDALRVWRRPRPVSGWC
ncbi:MAG: hypothetical protein ACNA8G_02295 [Gammaproteobacteria bacterium]